MSLDYCIHLAESDEELNQALERFWDECAPPRREVSEP